MAQKSFGDNFVLTSDFATKFRKDYCLNLGYYICHDTGIKCCYFLHSNFCFSKKKQVMEDYGLARSENVPWLQGFPL